MRLTRWIKAVVISISLGVLFASGDTLAQEAAVVKASYENWVVVPPAKNPLGPNSSSGVFFAGHNKPLPIPGTNTYLATLSFGQPFAPRIPYENFINHTLETALAALYYEFAAPADREKAAFRYKALLYKTEEVKGERYIRAQFETMANYWNETARLRALQAAQTIKEAIRYAPFDTNLRHALLDIYYDTAVADIALAHEKAVEVAKIMLELDPAAPGEAPGEFLISKEIARLEEALPLYRKAMEGYMSLLSDPMGVDVTEFEPSPARQHEPFGYYIFRVEVPQRSPRPALFKDNAGNWVLPKDAGPGDTQEPLFERYKDLALLFTLLRDYVRTAAQLAERYILRSNPATTREPSDFDKAHALIGAVLQATYVEASILLNIFPEVNGTSGAVDPASGLLESIASWRHEVNHFNFLRSYLRGETNLFGLTDDFLVTVQSQIPGDTKQYFDSYDFFAAYLKTDGSPLLIAKADWKKAEDDYDKYRDRNDQLALQFHDKNEQYDRRLREIVGVNPGEPGYDTPNLNVGSEIWQQALNIELARKRIEANQQEIADLYEQITIEVWRRGKEKGINNAMAKVYLDYGDQQASLTEEIAKISAAQVYANEMTAAWSSVSIDIGWPPGVSVGAGAYAHAINAGFQQHLEEAKGQKQAEKERLAARERAEIQSRQDALLDVNHKAQIKTWLLRMNILSIESVEATLILLQEGGRFTALFDEKEDLERRKEESNELLADRYFADPSHRLVKDSSILRAELSFKEAQLWLFFTLRAAEYKWNQKFAHTYQGRHYTNKTVFKLRNVRELQDLFDAIAAWNTRISLGTRSDDDYKKFSFREDFLGYRNGKDAKYHDPISGELVEPRQAFQSYLSQESLYLAPGDPDNPMQGFKALKLRFSTAFVPPTGGLFLLNRWLEKIQFLKVKVFGGTISGIESTVDGYLSYGGTSLIRNQVPGSQDPQEPDRWNNETTEYSTRHWFSQSGEWHSSETLRSPIKIQVSKDPEVPEDVYKINVFKERSVATTDWTLYVAVEGGGIPLIDLTEVTDIEFHMYFYWYARNLPEATRDAVLLEAQE
jgi:hypothetical protein